MEKVKIRILWGTWGIAPARWIRAHLRLVRLGWAAAILLCLFSADLASVKHSRAADNIMNSAGERLPDLQALRLEAKALEAGVKKLQTARSRLFRAQPAVLVDTVANRICIVRGERFLACGKCSTGSGAELTDTATGRRWIFDTPRGYFRAKGKISNPVWRRPDWAFVEEGLPVPKNAEERHVAEVLGDYAIGFGDGFFIHGTLYTRLLGANITHGCIRVDDEILEKIFAIAQPGTPIWIY